MTCFKQKKTCSLLKVTGNISFPNRKARKQKSSNSFCRESQTKSALRRRLSIFFENILLAFVSFLCQFDVLMSHHEPNTCVGGEPVCVFSLFLALFFLSQTFLAMANRLKFMRWSIMSSLLVVRLKRWHGFSQLKCRILQKQTDFGLVDNIREG